ncbi:hypothetical protein EPR50_G00202050 [Perca flavescens]|uniref:Uncharacterized protein n=1 Tax=Perca flavescens TaxID=8167 RepID=A0A484C3P6_PERFV|nr:hypothetical protein EPR50_G00202050 [Perca flavescens]
MNQTLSKRQHKIPEVFCFPLAESEATARCHTGSPASEPSSPSTPGFRAPGLSSSVRECPAGPDPNPDCSIAVQDLRSFLPKSVPPLVAVPAWRDKSLDGRVTDFTPSSEWRALSNTKLSNSSIPLTGDQQADADILAFIRARENLLNRTGPPQQ